MSKIRPTELRCPACGHLWQAILFDSVNATRLLQVTDQILDGTFEREQCSKCAFAFQPEHDLLYSDLVRGLWVVMRPSVDRDDLSAVEETILRVFTDSFAAAPALVQSHLSAARPRLVFGHRELRECLAIERSGVPAPLVECAKLQIVRALLPELAPLGGARLLFEDIVHDGTDARFVVLGDSDGASPGLVRLPMSALYELAEQEDDYRARYPALFERPYVSIRRYLD